MHHQLRRMGSTCPFILIIHDADPAHEISPHGMAMIERTFGHDGWLPLSRLAAGTTHAGSSHLLNHMTASGRRLYQSRLIHLTHAKVWVWALPPHRFRRVFFIE